MCVSWAVSSTKLLQSTVKKLKTSGPQLVRSQLRWGARLGGFAGCAGCLPGVLGARRAPVRLCGYSKFYWGGGGEEFVVCF